MRNSEYIWTPEDPEDEPVARLTLPNGEDFEATRKTASVYSFLGGLALYNHVYCYDLKDEEVQQSFYIFSFVNGYEELREYMLANNYPAHINLDEVGAGDVEAFYRAQTRDIGDTVPEEWL